MTISSNQKLCYDHVFSKFRVDCSSVVLYRKDDLHGMVVLYLLLSKSVRRRFSSFRPTPGGLQNGGEKD